MNSHVFECHDEQHDRRQFTKTVEALGEYARKHLKFPEDLDPLFATTVTLPVYDDRALRFFRARHVLVPLSVFTKTLSLSLSTLVTVARLSL